MEILGRNNKGEGKSSGYLRWFSNYGALEEQQPRDPWERSTRVLFSSPPGGAPLQPRTTNPSVPYAHTGSVRWDGGDGEVQWRAAGDSNLEKEKHGRERSGPRPGGL